MHILVIGATGTSKAAVVEHLTSDGFEFIDSEKPHDVEPGFQTEFDFLCGRITAHLKAQKVMNKKDVVTIRSPWDCMEVFLPLASGHMNVQEHANIMQVFNSVKPALEPPNAIIWCFSKPMAAFDRLALKQKKIDEIKFRTQLNLYEKFVDVVGVPVVELDTSGNYDAFAKSLQFGVASLRTAAVSSHTIWNRSFYK